MKKNFWNKLPWYVQLAIVGGAGYLVYRGVKKIIETKPPVPLPQGGAGLPVIGYTPSGTPQTWNPRPLSQELFDAMDGIFAWTSTKEEAWGKLANLPTNDMITAVYNDFNSQFGAGETLTQWIDAEYGNLIGSSNKPLALQRLRAIGLN